MGKILRIIGNMLLEYGAIAAGIGLLIAALAGGALHTYIAEIFLKIYG